MIFPRATYRLQLRAGFGFDEAAAVVPYLARLGVSHLYLSPFFKARPGSPHGYDITDHARLNPELGSEAEYSAMIEAFRGLGLKAILDFVPNHMGVGGADNPLWLDVLEWGPESHYAGWFDIDWSAREGERGGKLLAPVLGAQYGEELRSGKLALRFDEDGTFAIWAYGAHKLPICPLTYPMILGHDSEALDRISDRFLDLPQWRPQVAERALGLKAGLTEIARGDGEARRAIDERVCAFNRDWRELDRLIAAQFWRVAFFRVAEDEINYRRFFNINDLAGLRMELTPVFEHAHARALRMLETREIDGLRIDHVDGLFDPKSYLTALRERVERPFYLVVEKILAPHERLRADWPVEGTTGYDYMNLSLGLLVDASAEAALSETYRGFAGGGDSFEEIARDSKLRIMDNDMASELGALARAAARLCELWDLSLVDPDNRRAVDYREREAALAELTPRLEGGQDRSRLFESLLRSWRDGRIKLAVIALLLAFRRDHPELFAEGGYLPIETAGEDANWALGFARAAGERRLAVLAARFPALREEKPDWRARAQMPDGEWIDLVRGRRFDADAPLREWFGPLPFAVLASP